MNVRPIHQLLNILTTQTEAHCGVYAMPDGSYAQYLHIPNGHTALWHRDHWHLNTATTTYPADAVEIIAHLMVTTKPPSTPLTLPGPTTTHPRRETFLTTPQIANYYQVSQVTILNWAKKGRLAGFQTNDRRWHFLHPNPIPQPEETLQPTQDPTAPAPAR